MCGAATVAALAINIISDTDVSLAAEATAKQAMRSALLSRQATKLTRADWQ